MAGVTVPTDGRVNPGGPFFGDGWLKFFGALGRKANSVAQVDAVTTADASDPATTQALVNELKAKVNELLEAQNA